MSEWKQEAAGVYSLALDGRRLTIDRIGRDWHWTAGRKGERGGRGVAATLAEAKAAAESAAAALNSAAGIR